MADYRATSTEFTAVADAIRTKGGTSAQLTWPNGFVSAVQEIPTGSGVVQSLSVTQNGTYNPPSGVDGYAPVVVNVSGGGGSDIDTSYLPNSDETKILVSQDGSMADLDNKRWGRLTLWDFTVNSNIAAISKNNDGSIQFTQNSCAVYDLGTPNKDVTFYCVVKKPSTIGGDLGICSAFYASTYYQDPNFYNRNNFVVNVSTYGSDTATSYSIDTYRVLAIAVDCTSAQKVARFYIDGEYIMEKNVTYSGRQICFNGNATTSLGRNNCMFLYTGIVEEFESDAVVIANQQVIMQKLGLN